MPTLNKIVIKRTDYVFIPNTYDHRAGINLLYLLGADNLDYNPETHPAFTQIRVYKEGRCVLMTGLCHMVVRLDDGALSVSSHVFERLFEVMP